MGTTERGRDTSSRWGMVMRRKKRAGASISKGWVDPDAAPELTHEYFERADVYLGNKLVRRGRPKLKRPKQADAATRGKK
jgi:hypothetical protein